jgi:hypothetical protein
LRRFRRRCRTDLRRCLAAVLRRAEQSGFRPGCVGIPTAESQPGFSPNRMSIAGYDARFEIEADARIARAVQADSFAMDD